MPDQTEAAPEPTSKNEQTLALVLWLLDLGLTVIGPWILWRLKRQESKFVDFHGKACLNHTATILVLMLIACVVFGGLGLIADQADQPWLTIVIVGVLVLVLFGLGLATLVIHLIAGLKATAGLWYTPPLCWRFLK